MTAPTLPAGQLLAEVDDLLRTLPGLDSYQSASTAAWLGRAQAVLAAWNRMESMSFVHAATRFSSGYSLSENWRTMQVFLHRVRYELVLKTSEGGTAVIAKGEQFGFFEEVRKNIARARTEVFFVDPYLTDEFVSRFLPSIAAGTTVRLLGRENMRKLLPAVDMFRAESGLHIEARSGSGFHDRFVFLDRKECFQSSASFHQGGKTTPAVLTPMLDAATSLLDIYEAIWASGS